MSMLSNKSWRTIKGESSATSLALGCKLFIQSKPRSPRQQRLGWAHTQHDGHWQLRSCCSRPAWLPRMRPGTLQRLGRRSADAPAVCSPFSMPPLRRWSMLPQCNEFAQAQHSFSRPACAIHESEQKACGELPPGHAQGSPGSFHAMCASSSPIVCMLSWQRTSAVAADTLHPEPVNGGRARSSRAPQTASARAGQRSRCSAPNASAARPLSRMGAPPLLCSSALPAQRSAAGGARNAWLVRLQEISATTTGGGVHEAARKYF